MFEFVKEKTALVIVDLQNDFVREGGAMKVEEALPTLEANKKLIAFARKNGMPVIFTKFLIGNVKTFLWNWSPESGTKNNCKRGFERYYPDIDATRPCADVVDELGPILPEDYVVEKYNYSSFHHTNLIDILDSEGRDAVIFTGTVTQICVECTVHDAFAMGIKAIVASDCVSSFSSFQQQACLENIAHKFGVVATSDEIIARFG